MTDQNDDDFPELRELWEVFGSINHSRGIDTSQLFHILAAQKRDSLSQWTTDTDFDALCEEGCSAISLAIACWMIETSQSIGEIWRTVVGPTRRRKQTIKALEKAASTLERLQTSLNAVVLERAKKPLDEAVRRSVNIDPKLLNLASESEWPSRAPAPHPSTTSRALRLYARVLGMFESIAKEIPSHAPDTLSKYLISAYVKRATGEFHDAEVSALIGCALDAGIYDETAHRMWRSRNYARLDGKNSSLAQLLLGIGVVTARKT